MSELSLGQIIKETGDCGRFQISQVAMTTMISMNVIWSLYMMVFIAATPDWHCVVHTYGDDILDSWNGNNLSRKLVEHKVCHINGTKCHEFVFDPNMNTAVSEWDLVCDRSSIPSTITTIQFIGLFIGGFAWGHVSDLIGRKPIFFTGIALIGVFNLLSYFSVNWQMFAAMRFLTGVAVTACIDSSTTFEYIRNRWRIYMYLVAGWAVWTSALAMVCWWLHDWHYLNLIVAAASVPSLLVIFCCIPESFRWLVANGRLDKAECAINRVARWNRRPAPDLARVRELVRVEQQGAARQDAVLGMYTALDLLRGATLRKITLVFCVTWACSSFSYYGMAFGVEQLSGNLYLNILYSSLIDLPGYWIIVIASCCGGRRSLSMLFYTIAGILGVTVGIIQFTGITVPGVVVNWLAFFSKMFVNTAWELNMLLAMESMPTVVRNIGKGFLNSASRIGSITATKVVGVSMDKPGLLYTVSGILCLGCCLISLLLEETKDKDLPDLLPDRRRPGRGGGDHVTTEGHMKQRQDLLMTSNTSLAEKKQIDDHDVKY